MGAVKTALDFGRRQPDGKTRAKLGIGCARRYRDTRAAECRSDGSDGADGGLTWRLSGASERATYRFVDDGRNQEISWEWRPDGEWLPLCDRTARRID